MRKTRCKLWNLFWGCKKKNRKKKKKIFFQRARNLDMVKYTTKKWKLVGSASSFKSTDLFYYAVCWYLLRNSPFSRQMEAHPRKLLQSSYVQEKRVAFSLLRPSSELLHPHWPARHRRIPIKRQKYIWVKESKDWKLVKYLFPIQWEEREERQHGSV